MPSSSVIVCDYDGCLVSEVDDHLNEPFSEAIKFIKLAHKLNIPVYVVSARMVEDDIIESFKNKNLSKDVLKNIRILTACDIHANSYLDMAEICKKEQYRNIAKKNKIIMSIGNNIGDLYNDYDNNYSTYLALIPNPIVS